MIKKIFTSATIILLVLLIIIFIQNNYKIEIFGNNMSNISSCEDIQKYILNISKYSAVVDITINSNKTTNKYKIKQEYNNGQFYSEVLEPNTIKGTIITYNGKDLKIENSNLNVSKIYANYKYIASNQLSLYDFIEDYKNSADANLKEEENQVVLETTVKNENRYLTKKV